MEMLLPGNCIYSGRVHEMVPVNELVEDEPLKVHSLDMARRKAIKSSSAVENWKEDFYKQFEMPLGDPCAYVGEVQAANMVCTDAEAGIGAFITKKDMSEWHGQ